jgi:hypothetical protein
MSFSVGKFASFDYEAHAITVILTAEFVKRFGQRKPEPSRTEWLLREGIKEPLDVLIGMPGTKFISSILKAKKTKINVALAITRLSGKKIQVIATTVHVGQKFFTRIKDYVFQLEGRRRVPGVVFEREYEPELIQAVLDDLEPRLATLEDGAAYHLGNDTIDYIAEREGEMVRIPDARWMQDLYVYEFDV